MALDGTELPCGGRSILFGIFCVAAAPQLAKDAQKEKQDREMEALRKLASEHGITIDAEQAVSVVLLA